MVRVEQNWIKQTPKMINTFSQYIVEEERVVYFTFGRMNPPTIGHGKLLDVLAKKAGRNPYKVYMSQSTDAKKNPLSYSDKIKHTRKMFPKHARSIMINKKVRTAIEALVSLYDDGFRKIVMVVGSDRVREFDILLNKYNGVKARHGFYNFKSIDVISAGARDPDAQGVEGMSASKQRSNATSNDFTAFAQAFQITCLIQTLDVYLTMFGRVWVLKRPEILSGMCSLIQCQIPVKSSFRETCSNWVNKLLLKRQMKLAPLQYLDPIMS